MEEFWFSFFSWLYFLGLLCFPFSFPLFLFYLGRLSLFSLTKGKLLLYGLCGVWTWCCNMAHSGSYTVWEWHFQHRCLQQEYCFWCIFRVENGHKLVKLLFWEVCWWLLEKNVLICPGHGQASAFQYVGLLYWFSLLLLWLQFSAYYIVDVYCFSN